MSHQDPRGHDFLAPCVLATLSIQARTFPQNWRSMPLFAKIRGRFRKIQGAVVAYATIRVPAVDGSPMVFLMSVCDGKPISMEES
jgi:hypothetical protein